MLCSLMYRFHGGLNKVHAGTESNKPKALKIGMVLEKRSHILKGKT